MVNLKFDPPAQAGLKARIRQSATVDGARIIVGADADVDSLPVSGGKKVLSSAAADPTKYAWLSFLVQVGDPAVDIEGQESVLPPAPSLPGVVTVCGWASEVDQTAVAGVELLVRPKGGGQPSSGQKVVVAGSKVSSGADGYASIEIYADIGVVEVTFGSARRYLDTTGKGGTVVQWKDIPV